MQNALLALCYDNLVESNNYLKFSFDLNFAYEIKLFHFLQSFSLFLMSYLNKEKMLFVVKS